MNNKPVIANLHHCFFSKTETFIYNYISNLKNFRPICFASEYKNLNQFPFPQEDMFSFTKAYTTNWIIEKLIRKSYIDKTINKFNVKLIHAHFGPNGFYSIKLKKRHNIPLITTFYGWDISMLARNKEWRRRYKKLFSEGDLSLVEGNHMKSKLIELGCPESKIQIQRIAIPLQKITYIKRKPKKDNEKVIFIFSGRFVEKKGLIFALQAFNKIKNKLSNFELRIVGDGPLRTDIEKYIKDNNLDNFVKILGFLTYDNYLSVMSEADIFIHPSITASNGDSEGGAPTTILEAQAMGMPVISTYHADIPNIVIPGKSTLLSKEKDVNSLAKNIIRLMENQQKWESMGNNGRKFVETYHDIKIEVNELENKYRRVLNQVYSSTT